MLLGGINGLARRAPLIGPAIRVSFRPMDTISMKKADVGKVSFFEGLLDLSALALLQVFDFFFHVTTSR